MEKKRRKLESFENYKAKMLEALVKEESNLKEDIGKFEERVKQWEEATAKLKNTHFSSMINFNIGGRMFTTSLSNLQRYPESYFGVMFSGRWDSKPGEDGRYFIDRSPRVFDYILDYLRGEQLELELIPKEDKALLLREAKFYQLHQLVETIDPPIAELQWELKPNQNGVLSNNNRTFTKTRDGTEGNCNVMGTIGWSSGVHEWTVILGENCQYVMIGIATNNTNPIGQNYESNGYYLYTHDGNLYGQNGVNCVTYHKSRLHENQRISVKLDMDAKSLTFAVDGVWKGIAWGTIPQATYYPSFDVYTSQATFTVIP